MKKNGEFCVKAATFGMMKRKQNQNKQKILTNKFLRVSHTLNWWNCIIAKSFKKLINKYICGYKFRHVNHNYFNWIHSSWLSISFSGTGRRWYVTVCGEYEFRHKKDCNRIFEWSHKLKETKIMIDYMGKRKNQFELSMHLMRTDFHQRSVIIVNKVDKREREKNTQWFNTVISLKSNEEKRNNF